jgi:CRISPR-associated protein Csb1
MSDGQVDVKQFDGWIIDDSDVAALVMRQSLEPVEGRDAVVFPPTYLKPRDWSGANEWPGYNIDFSVDGNVCQIDSVGSQANRMEPIFKRERYKHLVPQVVIEAEKNRKVHLLDAGHRAADAIVRFSTLGPEFHEAFRSFAVDGNAEPLGRLAPTSIVFGSWDSRATQAKLPRIVRSVIRAYQVKPLHRSAQYSTIAGEILKSGEAAVTSEGPEAALGLAHVPAVWTHGGVQVQGEIRRDAILNLSALRAVAGSNDDSTLKLRRYLLGLSLVCFTAQPESFLREGCQLVPDPNRPAEWKSVNCDGTRRDVTVSADQALAFANLAANDFGVRESVTGEFDSALANKVLGLSEGDRKQLLRQGVVTKQAIEQLSKKASKDARRGQSSDQASGS